jgi:16S rRNA processing protein RimM
MSGADSEVRVTVGRIVGVYGVRGWVKLFSYTSPMENLLGFRQFESDGEALVLEEGKPHGKTLVGRFAGVPDRDAAMRLVGRELAVPRSALPAAGEDEYYWADLEGLRVSGQDGRDFGRVAYLIETGAHDVMVVRHAGGDPDEELIPFVVGDVVRRVDLAGGVIEVDWRGIDDRADG